MLSRSHTENRILWKKFNTKARVQYYGTVHSHVTKMMFTHDWQQNQKRFTEEQQERSKTHAENVNVLGLFSLGKVQQRNDNQDAYGPENQRKLLVLSFNATAMTIQMKLPC